MTSTLSLNLKRVTCNTNKLTALASAAISNRYSIRLNSSSAPSPAASTSSDLFKQPKRQNSSVTADAAEVTACPHFAFNTTESNTPAIHQTAEWQNALPYHEIPGPKPIPILGNTWR